MSPFERARVHNNDIPGLYLRLVSAPLVSRVTYARQLDDPLSAITGTIVIYALVSGYNLVRGRPCALRSSTPNHRVCQQLQTCE